MKKNSFIATFFIVAVLVIVAPFCARAAAVINEIMYDLEGADDKREWVEIFNDSNADINLVGWKFNDGSSHVLNEPPKNNGRGALSVSANGYIVFVADALTFIKEHQNYSGTVIDTAMSLGNIKETLKLINADGATVDMVNYESGQGANGDGKSLQKINSQWIAAAPTAGAQNYSQTSSQSSSAQSSTANSQISQQNQSGSNAGGVANWPIEPQIFANAGENKTGIAGADILFEGKALGLKKEPLENARYLWNFGDWTSAEGKNVRHFYKNTGEYIAVLDVSSGQYSTSDRVNVKVVPNELHIADANSEFIKLKNKSNILLDISGWFLKAGGVLFRSPDSSLIMANAELIISADVSKIKFTEGSSLDLLYPNGSVAFSYKKENKVSSSISSTAATNTSGIAAVKTISASFPKRNFENVHKGNSSASFLENLPAASSTLQSNNQAASVIYVAESSKSGWKNWLYLALFLGFFSGGGLFFVRRDGGG